MQTHHYRYADCRATFLELAADHEEFITHVHPMAGPDGKIAMDVALFGDLDANRVMVVSSGTHGIEGYAGSYIQCQLLADGWQRDLPDDLMLVMIHGVNPHGFAWWRRVNEDNIDLNRNFIDHSKQPVNEGYRELAEILEPAEWAADTSDEIATSLQAVAQKHDDPLWLRAAMTAGQYEYPSGLFYGGDGPAWSNQRLRGLADELLSGRAVAWLDVHTALGAFGEAECIVEYAPGSQSLEAAGVLWGERVRNTKTKESLSADVAGSISAGMHQELGDSLVIAGLEYGTVKPRDVTGALIADQWLANHGERDSPLGQSIQQQMMDAFYPDDESWRQSIYKIATELLTPMLRPK